MYIEAQRKDHQHGEHASGGLICVHMAWALTDEVKVPCMRLRSMDRNTGINTSRRQGWNRDTMFSRVTQGNFTPTFPRIRT